MAIGDINETQRPRYQDNQRFDEVDAQAESELRVAREAMLIKAALGGGLPFVSGFGETIGLVLQGGSIVGQSGGTSLVTLGAELFAAIDADGALLIKSAATGSLTTSCPVGTSTVYAYAADTPDTNAQRAFMTAVATFNEFFQGTNTRFTNKVGLIAISGDGTVNSAVVNGVTKALVAVALVQNTAGNTTITKQYTNVLHTVRPLAMGLTNDAAFNITVTGTAGATSWTYVVVARGRKGEVLKISVPFTFAAGPAILNTLGQQNSINWTPLPEAQDYLVYRTASGGTPSSTGLITPSPIVLPPGYTAGVSFIDTGFAGDSSSVPAASVDPEIMPANNTDRGAGGSTSLSTLGLVRTLATIVADVKFKRSAPGTQTNPQQAAKNYGLYASIRRGLDATDRSTNFVWTVGDGVTTFGDFDLVNYANFNALLTDLFASINLTAQVALANGQTSLNDKFTVLIKPGAGPYTLTANIQTPSNIVFMGMGPTAISVTQTSSLGGFVVNTNGRSVISLNGFKLTLADSSEMVGIIVLQAVAGGNCVLNGRNRVDNCTFVQQYGTAVPGNDPVLLANATPPAGGTTDIMVTRSRFYCFNNTGSALTSNNKNTQFAGISFTSCRDLTIRDCVFAIDTQFTGATSTQKPIFTTMLALRSSVKNLVIEDCRFDMYDDLMNVATQVTSGIVQPAIFVTAAVGAEANKYIRIYGCDISCRNWRTGNSTYPVPPSGAVPEYNGIEINEEINVEVDDCRITNMNRAVYFTMANPSAHTYTHQFTRVRNCNISSWVNGGVEFSATSGVATIRGVRIYDNMFTLANGGVAGILSGNNTGTDHMIFVSCNIVKNQFFDFQTVGQPTAIYLRVNSISGLTIDENIHENGGQFLNINGVSSGAADGISISNNKLRNCATSSAAMGQLIFATSAAWNNVAIKGNMFSKIMTGLANATGQQIVFWDAGPSLTNFDFVDNVFSQCCTSVNTGTRAVYLAIQIDNPSLGHFIENIEITDNVFGDATSCCEALAILASTGGTGTVFSRNINVSNNQLSENYGSAATIGVSWRIGDGSDVILWGGVQFNHNETYYEAGGGTVTSTVDSVQVFGRKIFDLTAIGNTWFGNLIAWSGVVGFSIAAPGQVGTIASTKLAYNSAARTDAAATGFTYFTAGSATGNTSA